VSLTAAAASGSSFAGWGGSCSGTGACTVSMTAARTVSATFNASGGGNGGVTVTPIVAQNQPWYHEQDIRIDNTSSLTALTVTVVIQRTTGESYSGMYNTIGGQIVQSNGSTTAAITYTFRLASGTIGAGSNRLFAAQAGGTGTAHPTAGDTWTVTYTAGGQSYTQTGHI
jgi:hypothetical protein